MSPSRRFSPEEGEEEDWRDDDAAADRRSGVSWPDTDMTASFLKYGSSRSMSAALVSTFAESSTLPHATREAHMASTRASSCLTSHLRSQGDASEFVPTRSVVFRYPEASMAASRPIEGCSRRPPRT